MISTVITDLELRVVRLCGVPAAVAGGHGAAGAGVDVRLDPGHLLVISSVHAVHGLRGGGGGGGVLGGGGGGARLPRRDQS